MKKEDKTQILLENPNLFLATLEEFSKKSYFESSTNEILKKSNYNKGSFYYRFSNKADLYVALLDYIIVAQIELFNNRQLSITKSNSLEELLYELYLNLYELFKQNKQYYYALYNGFNDSEASLIITENCLEPLYNRFMIKFNDFPKYIQSNELKLIINNLYFHFPIQVLQSDKAEEEIIKIVRYILNHHKEEGTTKTKEKISLDEISFHNNLAYVITKSEDYVYPNSWEDIFNDLPNTKQIIKILKKSLGLIIFNYKNAILKAIDTNLKSNQYLLGYLNDNLLTLTRQDETFYYFLVVCFYHSLKETDNLVIDLRNCFFNQEKLGLFYQHILPILTKTSKILVLSDFYVIDEPINTLYLIDNQGFIKPYSYKEIRNHYQNTLVINYFENSSHKTIELAFNNISDFDLDGFIRKNKITSIKTVYKLYFNDVLQSEVNQ